MPRSSSSGCGLLIAAAAVLVALSAVRSLISEVASTLRISPSTLALGAGAALVTPIALALVVMPILRIRREQKRLDDLRRRAEAARAELVRQAQAEAEEARRRSAASLSELRRQWEDSGRQAEVALAEILTRTRHLVHQHRDALRTQFLCSVHKDHYGRLILDRWLRELAYFVEKIVLPEIEPSVRAFQHARGSYQGISYQLGCSVSETYRFPGDIAGIVLKCVSAEYSRFGDDVPRDFESEEEVSGGEDYERLCAVRLRNAGWSVTERGGCGDQGVDLLAQKDATRVAFQCKFYETPVGNDAVQQAHTGAAIVGAPYAAVVSRSGYTKAARIAAHATGVLLLATEDLVRFELRRGGA